VRGPAGTPEPPLRIVVADDQASVREGLAAMLGMLPGIEVVACAADGEQAIAAVAAWHPDAILLDLRMPVLDGIEATRQLARQHPGVAVVVLTTYDDDTSVLSALRAGARSYITKDASRDDIRRALEAAVAGQAVLDPGVQARLVHAVRPRIPQAADLPDGLTEREGQILILIAEGLSNAEIAERLVVGAATVKTHINRIFTKTQSRDRAQATTYAHRHGLVP